MIYTITEDRWRVMGRLVIVQCPGCDRRAPLDHTIHPDGTVEPSVECPFEECTFHEHVRLENWEDR